MKIFINSSHQIKAINTNNTDDNSLQEIQVEDNFLQNYCDTVKCSFCYHKWIDKNGSECLSIYPYKDLSIMEAIQEQYEENQVLFHNHLETIIDNDYRLSIMELGLN